MYYGDTPDIENQGVFSSGDEIDRFFCTDQNNAEKFGSTRPWMLGPLRRALRFSRRGVVPGGHIRSLSEGSVLNVHNAIYYTECIEVNENSWFPFFKKDRWWDTVWFDRDPLICGPWTVDKPKIWAHLRIAIELANRILNALIKDRHTFLHTILFGQLARWSDPAWQPAPCPEPHPGAKVLLSHAFMKQRWIEKNGDVPYVMDITLDFPEGTWRERIEYLCAEQQWGFGPGEDIDSEAFLGLHMPQYILLNIGRLRKLVSDEITLAERCATTVFQAVTIVHELAHGIQCNRLRKDANPLFTKLGAVDFRNDRFADCEPFIDFGGGAEMGCAAEVGFFGGVTYSSLNIVTHPFKTSWPRANKNLSHGNTADGHPAFREGELEVVTLIPAFWASKILSEEFWKDESIPRKSDNFFHSIDYFRSVFPYRADNSVTKPAPVIERREYLADRQAQGLLAEEFVDLIVDWELRESLWNQARAGWYQEQHKTWKESAWGMLAARGWLYLFGKQLRQNSSSRDMFRCAMSAFSMTFTVNWTSRQNDYFADLNGKLKTWPWHAVGLLMLAVMPIRLDFETRKVLNVEIWTSLTPSSQNPRPARSYNRSQNQRDYYPTFVPESQFFDPFDQDGQYIPVGTFNHIDYLDQVLKLVNHFTQSGMLVSKPWIDEIVRVEAKIRERRIDLGKQGISGVESFAVWADDAWDFKIPEYDPTEHWYNVISGRFEVGVVRPITGENLLN